MHPDETLLILSPTDVELLRLSLEMARASVTLYEAQRAALAELAPGVHMPDMPVAARDSVHAAIDAMLARLDTASKPCESAAHVRHPT